MNQDAVSCELHDYIEVACLYGYQLKLTLRNKQIFEGKAIDIINSTEKGECLIIDNDMQQQIELIQLKKMQVMTPHAKFNEIIF